MTKYWLYKNTFFLCILLLCCTSLSACSNYNNTSDRISKYQFLYAKKQTMLNEYSNLFNDTNKNSEQITQMDQQIYEISRQLNDLEKDPKVKEYAKSLEAENTNNNIHTADIYDDFANPKNFDSISSSSEIQDFDSIELNSTDLSYENSSNDLNFTTDNSKNDDKYSEMTDEYENESGDIRNKIDTSTSETDSESSFDNVVDEDEYKETI